MCGALVQVDPLGDHYLQSLNECEALSLSLPAAPPPPKRVRGELVDCVHDPPPLPLSIRLPRCLRHAPHAPTVRKVSLYLRCRKINNSNIILYKCIAGEQYMPYNFTTHRARSQRQVFYSHPGAITLLMGPRSKSLSSPIQMFRPDGWNSTGRSSTRSTERILQPFTATTADAG